MEMKMKVSGNAAKADAETSIEDWALPSSVISYVNGNERIILLDSGAYKAHHHDQFFLKSGFHCFALYSREWHEIPLEGRAEEGFECGKAMRIISVNTIDGGQEKPERLDYALKFFPDRVDMMNLRTGQSPFRSFKRDKAATDLLTRFPHFQNRYATRDVTIVESQIEIPAEMATDQYRWECYQTINIWKGSCIFCKRNETSRGCRKSKSC